MRNFGKKKRSKEKAKKRSCSTRGSSIPKQVWCTDVHTYIRLHVLFSAPLLFFLSIYLVIPFIYSSINLFIISFSRSCRRSNQPARTVPAPVYKHFSSRCPIHSPPFRVLRPRFALSLLLPLWPFDTGFARRCGYHIFLPQEECYWGVSQFLGYPRDTHQMMYIIPPRISNEPCAALQVSQARIYNNWHNLPSAKRENSPPSVSIDKKTQSGIGY